MAIEERTAGATGEGSALTRAADIAFAPIDWMLARVRGGTLLVFALLLIPQLITAVLLVLASRDSARFSEAEVMGVDYGVALHRLHGELQRRRVAHGALPTEGLNEALSQVDRVDDAHGAALSAATQQTHTDWVRLRGKLRAVRAEDVGESMSPLAAETLALLQNDVGNASNLILDPDLDSYWLMDAWLIKLPTLTAQLAELRHAHAQIAGATPEERFELAGAVGLVSSNTRDLVDVDAKTAFEDNEASNPTRAGSRELRPKLEEGFGAVRSANNDYATALRASLVDPARATTLDLEALGASASKTTETLTERIAPELRKLCAVRATHYRHQLDRGLLSAIVAILAKAYVFAAYHRSSREASVRAMAEREKSRENAELAKALEDLGRAHHELQASKEQLVRSETMASLGGMVAGIAHEINTPVGTSLTAMSHLDEQVERLEEAFKAGTMKKSMLTEFFEDCSLARRSINTNLTRTAELVRSFKLVAADQTSDAPRLIDVDEYLRDVVVSLGPELKKAGHKISIESTEGLRVRTYPGALSQIVTNLTMNAIVHAYEHGQKGNLRLVIGKNEADPKTPVCIAYADDGRGIPEEHLASVFDPFFTTKRGNGGTGLGLHVVYNLVNQKLGGEIACASVVGTGTTFTIKLPLEVAE